MNIKINFVKVFGLTALIFWGFIPLALGENYVKFTPKTGDQLFNIFKKYGIPANPTTIDYFKEINNVRRIDKLLKGKPYALPIVKVKYDGKSITSSIPELRPKLSPKIIQYNKLALQKKLRKSSYKKNKEIWVPMNYVAVKLKTSVKTESKAVTIKNNTQSSRLSKIESEKAYQDIPVIKETNTAPKVDRANNIPAAEQIESETEDEPIRFTPYNEEAIISSSSKTKTVPLFGENFEEVKIKDESLAGKIYYLVSGHGGPDPGTLYHGDRMLLCEDEYAYDVTLRLARVLMEHSATVHMIIQDPDDGIRNEAYLKIDHDEKCITGKPLALNQKIRLAQTTDAINDLYRSYRNQGVSKSDQLAINIHIDSRDADMRRDVYFYYQENSDESLNMARQLQQTFNQKYSELSGREYKGTVSSRNLFVMRNTIPTTVFMELGNIQNILDHKRILYSNNRQALAEWLYAGLVSE